MGYEIISHTADLRFKVTAATLGELFSEAAKALMAIIAPPLAGGKKAAGEIRTIKLAAADRTSLLVDFLNELLSLSHVYQEVYPEISLKTLTDTTIQAEARGAVVADFAEDIKAVTYHEAEITQDKNGRWQTTIVCDI